MDVKAKICLICGVNANKVEKYNRYNVVPIRKKGGKASAKDDLSASDSDDSSGNSKSKKKAPPPKTNSRTPVGAPVSSRQTRNQNPKTFAVSLCKAMDLPDTLDQPFLLIFSGADYCGDCMTKVKEIHACQSELDKIQKKLSEHRVDIELDMSKHLQKIPFCKNVLRNDDYSRYKEDLDLILDFHGTDKKKNILDGDDDDGEEDYQPTKTTKRQQQAASKEPVNKKVAELQKIKMKLKLKRKMEEDAADGDDGSVKVSKKEENDEYTVENSGTYEIEKISEPASETNGVEGKIEEEQEAVVKEEENPEPMEVEPTKPLPPVKAKKDPNLKCPHCVIPRYFNKAENLEEHVNKAHSRKHACDNCERKFHSQKELQTHKLKVHDIVEESPGWICGFCDKDFAQKRYLEDHLDRHQEAKPLNCQFCGGSFPRKDSLKRAFQIFKGEPVDACGKCGRNLNLKDYLEHNRRVKDQ